jgi:hypothetical protein
MRQRSLKCLRAGKQDIGSGNGYGPMATRESEGQVTKPPDTNLLTRISRDGESRARIVMGCDSQRVGVAP